MRQGVSRSRAAHSESEYVYVLMFALCGPCARLLVLGVCVVLWRAVRVAYIFFLFYSNTKYKKCSRTLQHGEDTDTRTPAPDGCVLSGVEVHRPDPLLYGRGVRPVLYVYLQTLPPARATCLDDCPTFSDKSVLCKKNCTPSPAPCTFDFGLWTLVLRTFLGLLL